MGAQWIIGGAKPPLAPLKPTYATKLCEISTALPGQDIAFKSGIYRVRIQQCPAFTEYTHTHTPITNSHTKLLSILLLSSWYTTVLRSGTKRKFLHVGQGWCGKYPLLRIHE